MDPNATLSTMLERARATLRASETEDIPQDAIDLAEAVENLNTWIVTGGFLPSKWVRS